MPTSTARRESIGPVHRTLIFASLAAAVGSTPYAARGADPSPPSPVLLTYHWAVTGPQEPHADISGLPIRRDTVVLYEHQYGLYPRFYMGAAEHGGIPQNTNMPAHLAKLRSDLDYYIPDPNWSGYAVIDYEQWMFIWETHFVPVETYNASIAWTRQRNPGLTGAALEARAKADFEAAAQNFLLTTLRESKRLRPNAKWGFYMAPWYDLRNHDARLRPFYDEMTAFFPHAYCDYFGIAGGTPTAGQRLASAYDSELRDKINYARQIAGDRPVLAFGRLRYYEENRQYGLQSLNALDLSAMLRQPYRHGADGLVFWDYISRPADGQQFAALAGRLRTEVPAALAAMPAMPRYTAPGGAPSGDGAAGPATPPPSAPPPAPSQPQRPVVALPPGTLSNNATTTFTRSTPSGNTSSNSNAAPAGAASSASSAQPKAPATGVPSSGAAPAATQPARSGSAPAPAPPPAPQPAKTQTFTKTKP